VAQKNEFSMPEPHRVTDTNGDVVLELRQNEEKVAAINFTVLMRNLFLAFLGRRGRPQKEH
jgi:hypothetical protein